MKTGKNLLLDSVVLGGCAFLGKVITFLLMPLYTAYLSPADYGVLDILINTAVLLVPFASLYAPETLFRFLAGGWQEGRSLRASLWLLFGGVLLLFFLCLPALSRFSVFHGYVFLLALYILAALFHSFLSHWQKARGQYRLHALFQLLGTVLTVFLQVLFLKGFSLGVRGYLLAVIAADTLFSLVRLVLLFRGGKEKRREGDVRTMLRYALPLMPTTALWWLTSYSDRYILRHFHGDIPTGLYAAAVKLPLLLSFFVGIFMELWQYVALREREERRGALFSEVFGVFLLFAFSGAAALMLFARPVIHVLYHSAYEGALPLVPPLVLGALFSALGTFLGSAYQVKLRSGAMFFTSLAGAVCNLFFNFLLIPPLGAMGAAISTVASYFVIFLLRLLHTAKLLALRRHVALWAPAVGYLSLAAVFLSKGEWLLALVPVLLVPLCFLPVLKEVKTLVFLLLFRQKTGQVIDKGEDVLYNK